LSIVAFLVFYSLTYITSKPVEAASTNIWKAEYYPNLNFSGSPVVTTHEKLDLNWGSSSPHSSIPVDGFSAIFSKEIDVPKDAFYRISGRADDGIRVYIDGKLIINHWKDGVNHYHKDIFLNAGSHSIKVEYYDKKYSAAIRVNVDLIKDIVNENWEAAYYSNANFDGIPIIKNSSFLDFNWRSGSPDKKIPNDNFTATFHKKLVVSNTAEYTFKGRADDGIKVYIDNALIINKWQDGVNYYNEKITLNPGEYLIRVEYYDKKYSAAINLDIENNSIPSNEWSAAYYPNKSFQGTPYRTNVKNLDLNWGSGSPGIGIPTDNFSAIFERNMTIPETGLYHFSGRADDGLRVYVNDELVINSWKDGVNPLNHLVELNKGNNLIRVEYYDGKYSAALKLDINKASLSSDSWLATYYPSKNFTGLPVKRDEGSNLDINWYSGSPAAGIPNDGFSGVLEKTFTVTSAGTYQLSGRGDDGIRIYVNGKKEIDLWKTGVNRFSKNIDLPVGNHKIKVEYFDDKYSAALKVDINKAGKQVIYKQSNYNSTFESALTKQMNTSTPPQTDKYRNNKAYIHRDYVEITRTGAITENNVRLRTSPKLGTTENIFETVNNGTKVSIIGDVKGDVYQGSTNWYKIKYKNTDLYVHASLASRNALIAKTTANVNVRESATTNSHIYTTLKAGTEVNIVKEGSEWHEINIGTWRNAKKSDVEYYLNPNNFSKDSKEYFQFLSLIGSAGINVNEVNTKLLSGKGILSGKASTFEQAAKTHNINEIYLISHSMLETGNGTSKLATGVEVGKNKAGVPTLVTSSNRNTLSNIKVTYNMFGIGAYDSCPLNCGAERAYSEGWFTPEAAIIGGAKFISNDYLKVGQDTLYKMKWNPAAPGTHQYASDIGWATKQTSKLYEFYSLLDTYTLVFDIPVYRK